MKAQQQTLAHDHVVLVDESNNELGTMEKMEAHEKALLHRAFSVFIFNDKGELLLQQRAFHKYHSAGLWTNTCCSHPRAGESLMEAVQRRLQEEMGFTCEVREKFKFIYKAPFDNGLTEHELDFIYTGTYNLDPVVNPDEVNAYKWMRLDDIIAEVYHKPYLYTEWFKIILKQYVSNL
ncbi:MAG: isopentenyl-diphosphate Delta-isomerase [Bacteroidia bacterium]|jgi:isopentenyl-diphosphate delta-isomerase|nr:isopentenyl-diphosphate Delta-isomerase [Bacteroidia bacterium]